MSLSILNSSQYQLWFKELLGTMQQPPLKARLPFFIGEVEVGSIEETIGQRLLQEGLLITRGKGYLVKSENANKKLAEIANWLKEQSLAGQWRNELLAIKSYSGRNIAKIERAAMRPLGLTTHAVYLLGMSEDGSHWLQRRANHKATDAGKLDALVGGLVAADESLELALERETMEEAGLELNNYRPTTRQGQFTTRRPIDAEIGGYMVEQGYWHLVTLPNHVTPHNQDGEVSGFELFSDNELVEQMMGGDVAHEACFIYSQLFNILEGVK